MRKTIVTLAAVFLLICAAAAANTRVVARVHAGDLIEIEGGWTTRLTGISVAPPNDPIGWLAYDFAKRRLEGQTVAMFTWTTDNTAATIVRDDEGRPFAQIRFGSGFANDIAVLLLEQGLARVDAEHLPEYCEDYVEIERSARRQGLGMWAGLD
jgi:endonuclease YncB( thermonuclease family)